MGFIGLIDAHLLALACHGKLGILLSRVSWTAGARHVPGLSTNAASTPPSCHCRKLNCLLPCTCSAGIQYVAPVHEFPEDKWNQVGVCARLGFRALSLGWCVLGVG